MTHNVIIKPSDIYRPPIKDLLCSLLDNYEVTFRPPKQNEKIINRLGALLFATGNYPQDSPRFILRPKQPAQSIESIWE